MKIIKRNLGKIVFILVVLIVGWMTFLFLGQSKVKNIDIANISVSEMKDGVYTGNFKGYRWSNTMKVTIENGEISDLNVVKNQAVNIPDLTDQLFARIIDKQTLQVDVITGATITSKAYLKAIENALTGNTAN